MWASFLSSSDRKRLRSANNSSIKQKIDMIGFYRDCTEQQSVP